MRALIFGAPLFGACSSSQSAPYEWIGTPWVTDDTGRAYLLDTGTPRTRLRPSVVDGAPGSFEATYPAPELAGVPMPRRPVVWTEELPDALVELEALGAVPSVGGVIGFDVLRRRPLTFDPDVRTLTFGGAPPERGLEVDLVIEGGSGTCVEEGCFEWGALRPMVEVGLGGELLTMLVDTGAPYVVVEPGLAEDFAWATTTHRTPWGGVEIVGESLVVGPVAGSAAIEVGSEALTEGLSRLAVEIGRPVHGLLGQSFLDQFVVHLDGDRMVLADRAEAPVTGFVNPGWQLADADEGYVVEVLTAGGAAEAAGFRLGDVIDRVDELPADTPAAEVARHYAELGDGAFTVAWVGQRVVELEVRDWLRSR